jgi:hypothetical protein
MPWPFNTGGSRGPARLDDWLPPGAWKLEHHWIDLELEPRAAFAALEGLRLRDLPIVRALFSLRALPFDPKTTAGRFFSTAPFVALDEEPGQERVSGVLGPFWDIRGGRLPARVATTPAEFRAALDDGTMAAIATFRVEPRAGGCRLWTETWAFAPRAAQAAQFTIYWLAIGPFSAWIRRMLLRGAWRLSREGAGDTGYGP